MPHVAFKHRFFEQASSSFITFRFTQSCLLVLAVLRMPCFGLFQHYIYLNVVNGRFQSCIVLIVGSSVFIVISGCFSQFYVCLMSSNQISFILSGVRLSICEQSLRLYVIDCRFQNLIMVLDRSSIPAILTRCFLNLFLPPLLLCNDSFRFLATRVLNGIISISFTHQITNGNIRKLTIMIMRRLLHLDFVRAGRLR